MTGPLSFLQVTTFYPPFGFGGDASYVHRLSHALADAGHHVDVVHSIDAFHLQHPSAPAARWEDHPGVHVYGLRSRLKWLTTVTAHQTGRPWLQQRELVAILNSRPYDVIHFHNISLFGPGVLMLTPEGRTPVKAYTTHEHWLVCPTHVLWKFNQRACEAPECLKCTLLAKRPPQFWRNTDLIERATSGVDLFLAPSRFVARMHAERGFARPFSVLPLFVDAEDRQWQEAPRPHPRPYFLFVGRLERLKGVDVLLRAAAEGPAVDLLIAGAGADEERLRQMAAANPRVHFLGEVAQASLGALYDHAIACCIPSLTYEVFPTVGIESLSHRTPIIAHDLGGLTELVQDSGGGILYRTDAELKAAMARMSGDEDGRRLMGERGYRMVTESWSKKEHLRRYLALIDNAAQARDARTRRSGR